MAIKLAVEEPATIASDKDGSTAPPDVFERLSSLRLRQTLEKRKTKKPLAPVGIRTPKPHEWYRTHDTYQYEGVLFLEREGMSKEWFFPTTDEVVAAPGEISPPGQTNVCTSCV